MGIHFIILLFFLGESDGGGGEFHRKDGD